MQTTKTKANNLCINKATTLKINSVLGKFIGAANLVFIKDVYYIF